MYFIYVITDNKQIYIGQTNNPERRFYDHVNKQVKSTKRFRKCNMFIVERCQSRGEALKKEGYYKNSSDRRKVKKLLFEGKLEKYRDIV
jgi:predicted GIY-YIG superfamily endonuclease